MAGAYLSGRSRGILTSAARPVLQRGLTLYEHGMKGASPQGSLESPNSNLSRVHPTLSPLPDFVRPQTSLKPRWLPHTPRLPRTHFCRHALEHVGKLTPDLSHIPMMCSSAWVGKDKGRVPDKWMAPSTRKDGRISLEVQVFFLTLFLTKRKSIVLTD